MSNTCSNHRIFYDLSHVVVLQLYCFIYIGSWTFTLCLPLLIHIFNDSLPLYAYNQKMPLIVEHMSAYMFGDLHMTRLMFLLHPNSRHQCYYVTCSPCGCVTLAIPPTMTSWHFAFPYRVFTCLTASVTNIVFRK